MACEKSTGASLSTAVTLATEMPAYDFGDVKLTSTGKKSFASLDLMENSREPSVLLESITGIVHSRTERRLSGVFPRGRRRVSCACHIETKSRH